MMKLFRICFAIWTASTAFAWTAVVPPQLLRDGISLSRRSPTGSSGQSRPSNGSPQPRRGSVEAQSSKSNAKGSESPPTKRRKLQATLGSLDGNTHADKENLARNVLTGARTRASSGNSKASSGSQSPTLSESLRHAEDIAKAARLKTQDVVDYRSTRIARTDLAKAYADAAVAAKTAGVQERVDRNVAKAKSAIAGANAAEAWEHQDNVIYSVPYAGNAELASARENVKQTTKAYEKSRRTGGKDSLSTTRTTPSFNFNSNTSPSSSGDSVNQG